jgi:peptide deformylase
MLDAPGAGLAAPQIGVGLRVFTWYVDGEVGHLVNPDASTSPRRRPGRPRGLPVDPRADLRLPPALSVVATGFDMYGEPVTIEGSELLARAIQHETDHLDGVLFIDRLDPSPQGGDEGHPRVRVVRAGRAPTVKVSPHRPAGWPLMRLVFAGTPEVAVPALDASLASAHELVAVVTRPDAPPAAAASSTPVPVAERAEELGVPVLKPEHPRDPEFQAALRELAPDCCPVVAYGALLPQSALDIPPHGWVNLHFSLLPAWRGAAPVQHAIWAGDEVTGATTFRIVKELDAGPTFG